MADAPRNRPDDTMRERASGSRLKFWLLFEANRLLLAGVVLAVVYAVIVFLGAVDPVPLRASMARSYPVETLFQAMATGIITGVTLVVSINQVVLSQELGPLGDQHERMEGAMEFRETVEDVLGRPVSPAEPSSFLAALVEDAGSRADHLRETVADGRDTDVAERVVEYADGVVDNAESVSDDLADAQFGTFDVLSAALDFNYSWKLYGARRLHNEYGDALSDEANGAFEGLIEVLELFGPSREHVKTLYFQWELVDLSRVILYAAAPALVVAVAGILYLSDPGTITGATLGVDNLVWTVGAAAVVSLAPFAVLASYVLRIATVAKRTLAIGPFVLREMDGAGDEEE